MQIKRAFLFYPVKSTLQHLVQPINIYFRLNLLAQILLVAYKKHLIHIRQLIGLELDCVRDIGVKQTECRQPMSDTVRTNIVQA